jgi:hypothetical protein
MVAFDQVSNERTYITSSRVVTCHLYSTNNKEELKHLLQYPLLSRERE